ncbi:hypothetical protein AKJ09_09153 [Labilithrix luteola]|uniref:VWFA domain-containing protein n=1 Tax=Labilithrix luteola TaxID=1391654 RepID=A0A0K1QAP1_9BACT|nr:vWA domain-containing protein [Labilithrix luteola]AKV02490.1 hypothetical protein AKJ09_09153 [Labilithrix luteola]
MRSFGGFMLKRAFVVLGLVSSVALACGGSSDDSEFGHGNGSSGGSSGGNGSSGFLDGDGGSNTGTSGGPGGTVTEACATSNANGQAEPVYLVFVVDRSGSMKYNPSPNNKWDSVLAGLTSFFKDPQSAGLFASEQVFPSSKDSCQSSSYQSQLVGMTALPDTAGTLATALASHGPDPNANTPTQPALTGAVAFAKTVQATGKKTAVVLVTDGEPNGCSSSVDNSAKAAGTGLPDIKTYVIGVGSELDNLDAIAAGGGTSKAVLISTSNPGQITTDFVNVLGQIRSAALSCDYALPAPPNGETLDKNKVNVQYTPKGGTAQTLDYSADCTNGTGWHYDNPNNPTKILICETSCNTLLQNAEGKIDIVFGCETQGTGIK